MVESVLICAFLARVLAYILNMKLSKTEWFFGTVFALVAYHTVPYFLRG